MTDIPNDQLTSLLRDARAFGRREGIEEVAVAIEESEGIRLNIATRRHVADFVRTLAPAKKPTKKVCHDLRCPIHGRTRRRANDD